MSEKSLSKHRHNAFLATKKRKKKRSTQKICSPNKKVLKESMLGSWYNQENESTTVVETVKPSCRQNKIINFQDQSESSDESDQDESNEKVPIFDWIININLHVVNIVHLIYILQKMQHFELVKGQN